MRRWWRYADKEVLVGLDETSKRWGRLGNPVRRGLVQSWPTTLQWRRVAVTERRTTGRKPEAGGPGLKRIVLVLDNLNIPASGLCTRPSSRPRHRAERLELHYTPKQGSVLNMAMELGVLCLDRRRERGSSANRDKYEVLVASSSPIPINTNVTGY